MKVVVQNICKFFYQNTGQTIGVLDNINLSIREGEFICLLGPSGCGKTTLLNIMAGLETADQGTVNIDDKPVCDASPDQVLVFQELALFPWMTVQDNVEFGLKLTGMPKAERRAISSRYLQMVHLENFAQAFPHQLSGGMKQRTAIARALAANPKILLMDEPFTALDHQTRSRLHQELLEIWAKTGKTIVFVTHNINEAMILADRICLFSTRPGTIKREVRVPLERFRSEVDPRLVKIKTEIMHFLKDELEQATEDEDRLVQAPVPVATTGRFSVAAGLLLKH